MGAPRSGEKLTGREIATARQLVKTEGAKTAARMLGLHDERTVRKVALGERVHPLTVSTVRARLDDL